MVDINYFRKINNLTGTNSVKEANLNSVKWQIRRDLLQSPLLEEVLINGAQQSIVIQDGSLDKQTKKINTLPDESFLCGDVVDWNSITWLITEFDLSEKFYSKGVMRHCTGQLKWIDTNGDTKSYPFTFKSDTATNFGVTTDKVMTIGNERRILIAPLNDDTKTINKDKRFIFDGRAWMVTAVDRISVDGLVTLTVDEDLKSSEFDNFDLEIADYYKNNETTNSPPDENTILIVGSDECRVGQAEIYSLSSGNGVWNLFSEDEVNSTDLGTIIVTNNICTLQANNQKKYGFVTLIANINGDTQIKKKIRIRSLF